MAIDVTCTKCLTRFQVSEKFAGKKGPCPKCKTIITVPDKKQEVVIHAPEVSGPVDSKGQAVLKPLTRKEVLLSPLIIGSIVGACLLVLLIALVLRISFPGGKIPPMLTILGSIVLAPPLAFAGYTFLRDDELEPHRGMDVILRLIAPSIVYPGLWGLYWLVFSYLGVYPSWTILAFVVPVAIAIGAFAAQASLDLEFMTGGLHYTMYLATTVLLRVIMGMQVNWNEPPRTAPVPRPAVTRQVGASLGPGVYAPNGSGYRPAGPG
jgi:hypothetical protein